MATKQCSKCRQMKPVVDFYKDRQTTSGLSSQCKQCSNTAKQQWRQDNRIRVNAYARQYRKRTPKMTAQRERRQHLRKTFNMSVEAFDALAANQDGKCAICKRPPNGRALDVDHCHETGRIRGLLCNACNRAVGALQNDAVRCKAAADYLTANPASRIHS